MNLLSLGLAHLIVTASLGGTGIPLGMPPTPEDPVLARVAPADCLCFMSWAGIASPDPTSKNETEQLLAEAEIQNFLTQIDRAIQKTIEQIDKEDDPAKQSEAQNTFGVLRTVLSHPAAIFLSKLKLAEKPKNIEAKETKGEGVDKPASSIDEIEAGLVLSLGKDAGQFKAAIDKMLEGAYSEAALPENIEIEGEPFTRIESEPKYPVTWGFHGDYFILAIGEKAVENILERMKQQPPQWWSAIEEQAPIQRRSTVTYVNVRALVNLALSQTDPKSQTDVKACLEMLGLANALALVQVSGLDGADYVNKTLLTLDGDTGGLLRLISDNPLRLEDLAAVPRDSTSAMALRLDLQQALEIVLASIEKMSPETRAAALGALDEAELALGVDLRHGVLGSLGDTWCVYNSPGEGGFLLTGFTAVVPLRAKPEFSLAYSRLIQLAKQQLTPDAGSPLDMSPRLEEFRFEGRDVYCLNVGVLAPAISMTDTEMVFGLSPQNVKAFLARGARHEPIHHLPRVADLFAGDKGPAMVTYWDSPRFFELFYPMLTLYAPAITNGLRSANVDVDMSLIPSGAAISRHLRPSLMTLRRSKYGIEMTSRETVPLPGMTAIWAMMALAAYDGSASPLDPEIPIPSLIDGNQQQESEPDGSQNGETTESP